MQNASRDFLLLFGDKVVVGDVDDVDDAVGRSVGGGGTLRRRQRLEKSSTSLYNTFSAIKLARPSNPEPATIVWLMKTAY